MKRICIHPKRFYFIFLKIFLVIAILVAAFFATRPDKFILQKKATTYNASLSILPSTMNITLPTSGTPAPLFDVPIFINTDNASVAGVDVVLRFDPSKLYLENIIPDARTTTSLKTFVPVDSNGNFDITQIKDAANSTGLISFGAVTYDWVTQTTTNLFQGNGVKLATLKFKPIGTDSTNVTFAHTVGATNDSNMVMGGQTPVDILNTVANLTIMITGVSPTDQISSVPSPSQINIAYINFRVKLLGAENTPEIKVRLKVVDLLSQLTPAPAPADSCLSPRSEQDYYKDIVLVADNIGIYHPKENSSFIYGSATVSTTSDGWVPLGGANPGRNYFISLKGPKHSNRMMINNIILNSGQPTSQNFDWTQNPLEPGDLPDPYHNMHQDCVVNSIDLSLIIDRIGRTDEESLLIGDVNYDGVVNSNDVSKVVNTLSTRPDDDL